MSWRLGAVAGIESLDLFAQHGSARIATSFVRPHRPANSTQQVALPGVLSVQVKIAARHGHISPATQAKITEKAEKLQKYFDRVSAINVTVDLEHRDNHHDAIKVELQVSAEHADDFVSAEVAAELFTALDSAIHKVEQQIKKHKEKMIDGHRQPGHKTFETP